MLTPIKVAGIEPAFLVHRRSPVHLNFRSYQLRKPHVTHAGSAYLFSAKVGKRPLPGKGLQDTPLGEG
jgi:hypothetical protein